MATTRRVDGPSGRFYHLEGHETELPSVTHILSVINKPALVAWAAREERAFVTETAAQLYEDLRALTPMSRTAFLTTLDQRLGKTKAHAKQTAAASEIGAQVHAYCEWWMRDQAGLTAVPKPRVCEEAWPSITAFEAWAQSCELKPLFVEQVVYSLAFGYAGTLDLYAEVHGVPTVIDFKTGKAVYGEAHLQNVAYQVAVAEMGHGLPDAGLIVRLPKSTRDPQFEVVRVGGRDKLFPVFQACLTLWRWWYAQELASKAAWAEKRAGGRQVADAAPPVSSPSCAV